MPGMQLAWGSYLFPVSSATIATATRAVLSDTGRVVRYVVRAQVEGALAGADQAANILLEAALRAALQVQYQDLRLLADTSPVVTATGLINATSLSGVRIVEGPNFANPYGGAEFATIRGFAFAAEAEYLAPDGAGAILSFAESLSITGDGGPTTRWRRPVNGPPVLQVIYPSSTVTAVQRGRAVGHTAAPPIPFPLWPEFEQTDRRVIEVDSPKRLGQGLIEYGVSWTYQFEADRPLVGFPGIPPL